MEKWVREIGGWMESRENLRGAFGDDLAFFSYLTEVYL